MSPVLLVLALVVGNPVAQPALVVTDTIRVHDMSIDDVLEAVALKAGIVKQGDEMRL